MNEAVLESSQDSAETLPGVGAGKAAPFHTPPRTITEPQARMALHVGLPHGQLIIRSTPAESTPQLPMLGAVGRFR